MKDILATLEATGFHDIEYYYFLISTSHPGWSLLATHNLLINLYIVFCI